MQSEAERIAAGLSEAQRRYILAVGAAGAPYEPRHSTTANWALRHKYADTIVQLECGSEMPWGEVDKPFGYPVEILGQRLSQTGLAVREVLMRPPVR